jgi:polyhydroxybutyrate depolymerase
MRKLFQGAFGSGQEWSQLARREQTVLLIPNGIDPETGNTRGDHQNWNDLRRGGQVRQSTADDVGFLTALLDWTEDRYQTDSERIYVTGASNGGMMTQRLILERPERVTAAVALISALPEVSVPLPDPKGVVPLLLINGTEDPLVPWKGGTVGHNRGKVRSGEATATFWVGANHASPQPLVKWLPDRDPRDGCEVETRVYAPLPGGAPVHFWILHGGGHLPPTRQKKSLGFLLRKFLGTPCREVEALDLTWDFMQRFP